MPVIKLLSFSSKGSLLCSALGYWGWDSANHITPLLAGFDNKEHWERLEGRSRRDFLLPLAY